MMISWLTVDFISVGCSIRGDVPLHPNLFKEQGDAFYIPPDGRKFGVFTDTFSKCITLLKAQQPRSKQSPLQSYVR